MGITGGLVKSVFSKSRSLGSEDNKNSKSCVTEKRRWSSVRSYFCGDELNSVLAEEGSVSSVKHFESEAVTVNSVAVEKDSVSVNCGSSVDCSEATVTQPVQEGQENAVQFRKKTDREELAAIIIQSAFRNFLAKHQRETGTETLVANQIPNVESLDAWAEVQTGNSAKIFSDEKERTVFLHKANQKLKSQVIKEDWDDSTVSSKISRMRIQNRLEASTRRERALAYAFSQQLRVCSKRKETKPDSIEPNMGWNWLERWMATRLVPEGSSAESCVNKSAEPIPLNQRLKTVKALFDVTGEEKESCGSNDVSVSFDGFSFKSFGKRDGFKPNRNRKTAQNISRRKTVPKDYTKVKKEGSFKSDYKRQKALGK